MMKRLSFLLIIGLVLALSAEVYAQGLRIDRSVIGSGGMVSETSRDGQYTMSGLVGQVAIETRYDSGLEFNQGFWVKLGEATSVEDSPITFSDEISNFPNPVNSSTTIRYELPGASYVTLKLYDVVGNMVKELYSGYQEAGPQEVFFDGKNAYGLELNSGSYVYELTVRPAQITGSNAFQAYNSRNVMIIVK